MTEFLGDIDAQRERTKELPRKLRRSERERIDRTEARSERSSLRWRPSFAGCRQSSTRPVKSWRLPSRSSTTAYKPPSSPSASLRPPTSRRN